jgi:RNA recognition motif-containing protein
MYSKVVRNEFGMSRGTGFVKFEDPESAKKCIAAAAVAPQKNVVGFSAL